MATTTESDLEPVEEYRDKGLKGGAPALPGRQRLITASGAVTELKGCFAVEVAAGDLRISARLSTEGAPPAIGAVVALDGPPEDLFNATEKLVLLPTVGEVIARGKHYSLDGGLGGLDFTFGFLARRTQWRWAFALGRARSAR